MPKAPAIPDNIIANAIKDLDILCDKGLKTETDPIWEVATEILCKINVIKKHNLYSKFRQKESKVLKLYLQLRSNSSKDLNFISKDREKAADFKSRINKLPISCENNTHILSDLLNPLSPNNESHICFNNNYESINDLNKILEMKFDVRFKSIIQQVWSDPFQVLFWSLEQLYLYRKFVRSTNFTIVLTASKCDKLEKAKCFNRLSEKLVLFKLSTNIDQFIVPLSQVITDKIKTSVLRNLILNFLKDAESQPHHLLTGYSKLLLNACLKAFNTLTLNQYNSECLNWMLDDSGNTILPKTIVHVDPTTLFFYVNNLKSLTSIKISVKEFYLKCIMYISTLSTLNDLKEVLFNIFILILSPTENKLTEEKLDFF